MSPYNKCFNTKHLKRIVLNHRRKNVDGVYMVKRKSSKSVKGIKRLAGKDVPGELSLQQALFRIKGFGHTMSKVVAQLVAERLNVPLDTQVGDLTDEQLEEMEHIITHLEETDLPRFLFNRQKDFREGVDKHLVMNDLIFAMKRDIEREKEIYSWRGYRHMFGQKVRGQRTKNTGRTGMAMGVIKKKK